MSSRSMMFGATSRTVMSRSVAGTSWCWHHALRRLPTPAPPSAATYRTRPLRAFMPRQSRPSARCAIRSRTTKLLPDPDAPKIAPILASGIRPLIHHLPGGRVTISDAGYIGNLPVYSGGVPPLVLTEKMSALSATTRRKSSAVVALRGFAVRVPPAFLAILITVAMVTCRWPLPTRRSKLSHWPRRPSVLG